MKGIDPDYMYVVDSLLGKWDGTAFLATNFYSKSLFMETTNCEKLWVSGQIVSFNSYVVF